MVSTRPHVLYTAWGFPPSRSSGVYRALATVNALVKDGFRVTVLTGDEESYRRYVGTDDSLLSTIPAQVEVRRIPFNWADKEPLINRYSRTHASFPMLWNAAYRISSQRYFPEHRYGPWAVDLTAAALSIHRQDPVSLAIGTANPNVVFVPGRELYRHYGVPYIMDYRDAWTLNTFTGKPVHSRGSRSSRTEASLLRDAAQAWFVNREIRDWHAQRYPDAATRMSVVMNGYDPEFLPATDSSLEVVPKDRPMRYGFLGTLSSTVPFEELIHGWIAAKETGAVHPDATLSIAGFLSHFGTPLPQHLTALDLGSSHGVRYLGPIPKTQVADFYANQDVLVLNVGGGKYVTSGKVFEYQATGKPILAVTKPDFGGLNVLADYPLAVISTGLSAEDVAEAFAAVEECSSTANSRYAQALKHALQYSRENQIAAGLRTIHSILERQ